MMFKSARWRLTLLYCGIFFGIFWLFSVGIFFLMHNSLGNNYVSKVTQAQTQQYGNHNDAGAAENTAETAAIAGSITETQLAQVLLALNGVLLLVVPSAAWLLTGKALRPVHQAYERQRRFVSDASHELRTPLTIMRGELDLSLRRKRTNLEYESAIRATKGEVNRLQRLVDSLLTLASADQHTISFDKEPFDLNDVIATVHERLKTSAKRKDVTMKFTELNHRKFVDGSSNMLEQLFTNLISNAIKHSGNGSAIKTIAKLKGNKVIISIVDNGAGMSPETVNRAFDRFYRADDSRSASGSGLGLAISKTIVEQHNGLIKLSSKLQQGTTVTIELPLHEG
jgi:two-component system sensor histidine kinase CiaH